MTEATTILTRAGLERLVQVLHNGAGDPSAIAAGVIAFMGEIGTGFSPTTFGNRLLQEIAHGCAKPASKTPALVQELARLLIAEPDHRGVSKVLRRVDEMRVQNRAFADIKIDHQKEFREATCLGNYDTAELGLAEITHRRTYTRPSPPTRAISTIHKAKGLECESVILLPVNADTFPDREDARCLLYVALSRATHRLQIVLSRTNPSPLFII